MSTVLVGLDQRSPQAVLLDPDGDVTLVVSNKDESKKEFQVSSKVLSLASPVFSSLFGSRFLEGSQLRTHGRARITLQEDEPTAMEIVLGVLHFRYEDDVASLGPDIFASVAVHCDKYDCVKAVRPRVQQWFSSFVASTTEEHGLVILAAFKLQVPNFYEICANAAKKLAPDFFKTWDKHDVLALLPCAISGASARI